MKIATWNLGHRVAALAWQDVLPLEDFDLVLLQEATEAAAEGLYWQSGSELNWGSAVYCRTGELREVRVPGYEGWVVGGELSGALVPDPEKPLYVFSLHAPSSRKSQPRGSYVSEVRSILSWLRGNLPEDAALIIGGDFNFTSLGERREHEEVQTTAAERKALADFTDAGLVSAWAAAHPAADLPQTLRWTGNPKRPFHCDGVLIPRSWANGVEAEVLTSPKVEAMSDHNPLVVTLRFD